MSGKARRPTAGLMLGILLLAGVLWPLESARSAPIQERFTNAVAAAAQVGDLDAERDPEAELAWSLRGILAVNLIIWTGLFMYLLMVNLRLRRMEKEP